MFPRIEELKQRFAQERLVRKGVKDLGVTLVDISRSYVRLNFTATEDYCVDGNQNVVLQGGVLDIAIDFAGVYAAMTTTEWEHTYFETNLTNYTNPIKPGELITVSANVERNVRREIWVSVETRGENGELKSHSKLKYVKPRPKSLYSK